MADAHDEFQNTQPFLEHRLRADGERFADRVFRRLGVTLGPTVALVGVPRGGGSAIVVAEPDHYSNALSNLEGEIRDEIAKAEMAKYDYPLIFEGVDRRCAAVGSVVSARIAAHLGNAPVFFSRPWEAGPFDLVAVMQVDRGVWETLPAADELRFRGLGGAVARCVMAAIRDAGVGFRGGAPPYFLQDRDLTGILREAGSVVMKSAESLAGLPLSGSGDLFQHVDVIASLFYERKAARGRLVLEPREDSRGLAIGFEEPVSLTESRWARKILETSTGPMTAVCDGRSIVGLNPLEESSGQIRVSIEFTGHHRWRLQVNGVPLMACDVGVPGFPKREVDRNVFEGALRRVLGDANPNFGALWKIVEALRSLDHGATVVIVKNPAAEAGRLRSSALPIVTTKLTGDTFKSVASIDGAVLLGPDATCHAIGVILDGASNPRESPARGSRFNSAMRYVEGDSEPSCVALVRSDDGGIDLLPALRPPITRRELEALVSKVSTNGEAKLTPDEVEACRRLVHYVPHIPEAIRQRVTYGSVDLETLFEGNFDPGLPWRYSVHSSDVVEDA